MVMLTKITSKGQVTVPKAVRDALDVRPGDRLEFRLEAGQATIARAPTLLDLAGSVRVPDEVRGLAWKEIERRAWARRAE